MAVHFSIFSCNYEELIREYAFVHELMLAANPASLGHRTSMGNRPPHLRIKLGPKCYDHITQIGLYQIKCKMTILLQYTYGKSYLLSCILRKNSYSP